MAKQLHLNTPSVKEWRFYFEAMVWGDDFRLGFDFTAYLRGREDGDVSFWLYLPGLRIGFGVENNPY